MALALLWPTPPGCPPTFFADVRYSMRSLTRTPIWTAALVLTIALGIGTSASVQGFVRGLLTTDLPIFAIERVVTVFATDNTGASGPVSFDVFTALNERARHLRVVGRDPRVAGTRLNRPAIHVDGGGCVYT